MDDSTSAGQIRESDRMLLLLKGVAGGSGDCGGDAASKARILEVNNVQINAHAKYLYVVG